MWLAPGGQVTVTDENGQRHTDTFTCGHCSRIVEVAVKAKPADIGGLCKVCMTLICASCVGRGCDPFEEKLKRQEQRDHTLKSYR
jgi:hypothetical protein